MMELALVMVTIFESLYWLNSSSSLRMKPRPPQTGYFGPYVRFVM